MKYKSTIRNSRVFLILLLKSKVYIKEIFLRTLILEKIRLKITTKVQWEAKEDKNAYDDVVVKKVKPR